MSASFLRHGRSTLPMPNEQRGMAEAHEPRCLRRMGQTRLFAVATSCLGGVILSDLRHMLAVVRYCVLTRGPLASLPSPS
jgi:hypothetical protein